MFVGLGCHLFVCMYGYIVHKLTKVVEDQNETKTSKQNTSLNSKKTLEKMDSFLFRVKTAANNHHYITLPHISYVCTSKFAWTNRSLYPQCLCMLFLVSGLVGWLVGVFIFFFSFCQKKKKQKIYSQQAREMYMAAAAAGFMFYNSGRILPVCYFILVL